MNTVRSKERPKKAFVPPTDRPKVQIAPHTPLRDVRVRDLAKILGPQLPNRDPGLLQKCVEKLNRDLYEQFSPLGRAVPGLKEFIQVESALTEEGSKLSQTTSTIVNYNWRARG
jgi:hypothetical protein